MDTLVTSATGTKFQELPEDDAPHLLVVDDDERLRSLLSRYLGDSGFRVSSASNAAEARRQLEGLEFDLMVVDVMMPGESGRDFIRWVRETPDFHAKGIPALMLTALAETDDRIAGLEAGADDYLSKPFDPKELLLRINSILKRTVKPFEPAIEQVTFGPYQYSVVREELEMNQEPVRLTDREKEIMTIFASRPGDTIARHELLGSDSLAGERKIDVQINRLRRKIEEDPANPKWLQTVRGIGYKLVVN